MPLPASRRLRVEPLEDRLTPAADGTPDPTFGPGASRFVTLDPSFGTGGQVLVPRVPGTPGGFTPYRLAVLADGSVLVADVGQNRVDVTRLTPAGAIDTGYGSAGTATARSDPAGDGIVSNGS